LGLKKKQIFFSFKEKTGGGEEVIQRKPIEWKLMIFLFLKLICRLFWPNWSFVDFRGILKTPFNVWTRPTSTPSPHHQVIFFAYVRILPWFDASRASKNTRIRPFSSSVRTVLDLISFRKRFSFLEFWIIISFIWILLPDRLFLAATHSDEKGGETPSFFRFH